MMQQRKIELRDIVIIGMLAAICVIATTIKIPYGHGAMVHLGTAAIFTIGSSPGILVSCSFKPTM